MQLFQAAFIAILIAGGVCADPTIRVWSQDHFKGKSLDFNNVVMNKCYDISTEKEESTTKAFYGSGSFEILSGPYCRLYDTPDCQCPTDGSHYCSDIRMAPGWDNWNEQGESKIWYKAFKCRSPFSITPGKPNDPW